MSSEFRIRGKQVIDEIADYYENLASIKPMATVEPGYLYKLLSHEVPETGESLNAIQKDIKEKIMPGMTHWQSPNFYAWFPSNTSFPAMLGDMYCGMFSIVEFNWLPVVMDALGKLIGLPERFMAIQEDGFEGDGGGVIQGGASEAMMVAMIAAREMATEKLKAQGVVEDEIVALRNSLIAYCSDQTHSAAQKAANLIGCQINVIQTASDFRLTKELLADAIAKDKQKGLIPFYVCATFGTTNTTAIDDLPGIADVAEAEGLWNHIDGAYAGAALACPEFQPLAKGIERCDSFNFNPHKWMLCNHSCCAMWVADSTHLVNAMAIQREYLPKVKKDKGFVKDYRDWQLPLGRPFRAMKLWFVLRMFGAEGIRKHIRKDVDNAKWLSEELVSDGRFELVVPVVFGLVVFRLKPSALPTHLQGSAEVENAANAAIANEINTDGRAFLLGTKLHGRDAIRVAVGSAASTRENVSELLGIIKDKTSVVLANLESN
ncbi:dopa decarboxylase protein [Linderina pennispora]|uniref:Dopa decarboxylase protein n=1 Tax=Linderina pennispora TaxID=61395 RepID=A0A1Y1W434_9FUNG|nr:dopa decarboxylase protein [Linderina pennispora]ORX67934.1 dopa decarboxylase protein [Linderina pennispora]